MTEPAGDALITYAGTSTTADFDFDYCLQAKSHMVAYVLSSTGVQTDLTLTTHYTIPDSDINQIDGGTLTLVNSSSFPWMSSSTLVTGYTLVMKRVVPLSQSLNISTNSTTTPRSVEATLDKLVMIDQQQQRVLDRVITAPDTDDAETLVLPSATARANTILAFDADGEPTTAVLTSVGASITAQYVTLATDSSLTNERVLTGTANQITVTDNGAGGTVVISLPASITVTTANATTVAATTGNITTVNATTVAATAVTGTHVDTTSYIKTTPGAAPSLANGQQWSDSTQIAPAHRTGGMTEYGVRCIYSQDFVTVANTNTITTLMTTPHFGTNTIAANYLTAGKVLRVRAFGTYAITGTPTLGFVFWHTTTAGVMTRIDHTTAAASSWELDCTVHVVSTTVARVSQRLTGSVDSVITTPISGVSHNAAFTIDATQTQTIGLAVIWGAASSSNTLTVRGLTIEVMG